MDINKLVERYLNDIEIEDVDFEPVDNAIHDAAYLCLNIPINMLREYQELKGEDINELPDGAEFWKETQLVKKLRTEEFSKILSHQPLYDILDFLNGEVWGNYQELNQPTDRIRLSITEVPEFFEY
jgi:hypothetical protein